MKRKLCNRVKIVPLFLSQISYYLDVKKVGIILALMIYIWGLAAPFVPLIDYAFKYDYYKNFLCVHQDKPNLHCNGQCVLMQKLQQEADKQKPTSVTFSPEEDLSLYAFDKWTYDCTTTEEVKPMHPTYWGYRAWVKTPITPPPQA
ncbi:MAG: hypothetical protein AAF135_17145 [Bacteroidota bacterium]